MDSDVQHRLVSFTANRWQRYPHRHRHRYQGIADTDHWSMGRGPRRPHRPAQGGNGNSGGHGRGRLLLRFPGARQRSGSRPGYRAAPDMAPLSIHDNFGHCPLHHPAGAPGNDRQHRPPPCSYQRPGLERNGLPNHPNHCPGDRRAHHRHPGVQLELFSGSPGICGYSRNVVAGQTALSHGDVRASNQPAPQHAGGVGVRLAAEDHIASYRDAADSKLRFPAPGVPAAGLYDRSFGPGICHRRHPGGSHGCGRSRCGGHYRGIRILYSPRVGYFSRSGRGLGICDPVRSVALVDSLFRVFGGVGILSVRV